MKFVQSSIHSRLCITFFSNGALSSHSNALLKSRAAWALAEQVRYLKPNRSKSIQIAWDGWKTLDFCRFFTSRCVKSCQKNVWASARGNAEDISKGRQTTNPGAWTNLKCCPPLPMFRSQERAACDYFDLFYSILQFFLVNLQILWHQNLILWP